MADTHEKKTVLYLDPFSGIAGDMLVGALLDLGVDLARLHHELGKLKLSGYRLSARRVMRGALSATKFDVEIDGALEAAHDHPGTPQGHGPASENGPHTHVHPHRTFAGIKRIIEDSGLSSRVKSDSLRVFTKLAETEGRVHDIPLERVSFHEVGALDSIVDIVGACAALELLGVDAIWCGPVALGSGYVQCAHGLLPVPAPATLELMKGIPLRPSPVEKELTTPTGAALLAGLCSKYGPLGGLNVQKIGYGAGSREQQAVPNVLRVALGTAAGPAEEDSSSDTIVEIQTNLDDTSPEVLGYLAETLLARGALDVFHTPVQMKKSRPGTLLTVLAEPRELDAVADFLFRESSTFGLRYQTLSRLKLARRMENVETPYGPVRVKVGTWRGRTASVHPEFEDCRARAAERGVPLKDVMEAARSAYHGRS